MPSSVQMRSPLTPAALTPKPKAVRWSKYESKAINYFITIGVITAGHARDNAVRSSVICLYGYIDIVVVIKDFEFRLLIYRSSFCGLKLEEISAPFTLSPCFIVKLSVDDRGSVYPGSVV